MNVNRIDEGICPGAAWYSPLNQSINFCVSGEEHPNMAFSVVIHHEYGHHLTEIANTMPVPQYAEGMSDCIAILLSDDPGLAYGYNGSCDESMRNKGNP